MKITIEWEADDMRTAVRESSALLNFFPDDTDIDVSGVDGPIAIRIEVTLDGPGALLDLAVEYADATIPRPPSGT